MKKTDETPNISPEIEECLESIKHNFSNSIADILAKSERNSGKSEGNFSEQVISSREITIGQYADHFDTGIWSFRDGACFAPDDLTTAQLRDHLLACGGFVYLHHTGKLAWANTRG